MTLDEMSKLFDEKMKEWNFELIKEAEKKGKIYDIDRLFWNDGKLFGYDTYFKDFTDYDGQVRQSGPWVKIKTEDKEYEVIFHWDWKHCFLVIQGETEVGTLLGRVPLAAQRQICFDMLFGVNPDVVKIMIHKAVNEIITYFKSKEGNNDK